MFPVLTGAPIQRRFSCVVLSTNDRRFAGHGRCETGVEYPHQRVPMYGRDQSVEIYLPSRSAQVLAPL